MTEPTDKPASHESEAARARSSETSASSRPVIRLRPSAIAISGRPLAVDNAKRSKAPSALSDEMREMIGLMVYGLEADDEIEGQAIKAGFPLTVRQAARHLGLRLKRARDFCDAPVFPVELERQLKLRRNGERARNLHTAIQIRDDEGLGLAADRTVRLKAISVIEGTDGKGVNISINSGNQTTINPGYVIRLQGRAEAPALKTIDQSGATIDQEDDDQ